MTLEAADDAERVDQIRLLEEVQAIAAAVQARVTVEFAASQEAAQRKAGMAAARVGRGIPDQIALARRASPAKARRELGWSRILISELPSTYAALAAGVTTARRAMIVARETVWLSAEHRLEVDAGLAPRLESWGDREVEAEVKRAAYRLDPHGYVKRCRYAETERRVTLRPAPDTMTWLSALLPVKDGVAAFAALTQAAASARAEGDPRSKGQVMADTLVQRVTGRDLAEVAEVEVSVVMTDHALLGLGDDADEPALVEGYGPVPAGLVRGWLGAEGVTAWVRRLFTAPTTGELIAMESHRRLFPSGLASFITIRDQVCRTSWCDAPIAHLDHVRAAHEGGATSDSNGQGLCVSCNLAKEAPAWTARPGPDGAGVGTITSTPTGHDYVSRPPRPPGSLPLAG